MKKVKQNSIIDVVVNKTCKYAKVHFNNGEELLTPFIYQGIRLEYDEHGYEQVITAKRCKNIVRFSPENLGEYRVDVYNVNDQIIDTKLYVSTKSNRQSKLVVKDGQAFYPDGKYFLPYGINLAFPEAYLDSDGQEFGKKQSVSFLGLRQYENWFRLCAKNGVNFVRIWCDCNYFSPNMVELDVFNYAQFTKLDKLMELANKYNIRLKLTIDHFRNLTDNESYKYSCECAFGSIFKRYLTYKGEVVNTYDWLMQEKYRKIWLKKLKQYQLRYSCNPALLAIEFWNEMNAYGDYPTVDYINDWNIYMVKYAREMFPNVLLLNSLGSLDCLPALDCYNNFCFDKFDWLQMHCYFDQGAGFDELKQNPIEAIKKTTSILQEKSKQIGKKIFLAETGAVNDCHSDPFRYYLIDDTGIMFIDTVYTPLFLGCSSIGNIWHWDDRYVTAKSLYKYYKPLKMAINDVDFIDEDFTCLDLSTNNFYVFVLKGKTKYLAFIRNKYYCWQNILKDCKKAKPFSEVIDFSPVLAKDIKSIKIWDDEKGKIMLNDDKLNISKLKYGILLKGNL